MLYSANEIVEIAVRIEENGHDFYTEVAKYFQDNKKFNILFNSLANKEIGHIEVFKKLSEQVEDEGFEFNLEESQDYLQHAADTHIFLKKNSGKELANTIKTSKEALEIAYKFEIQSVEFYNQMLTKAQTKAKKLIFHIIEEEKDHAAEIESYM
jgi:rubrerythrin